MKFLIALVIMFVIYWLVVLLLSIFKWNWLAEHPGLYQRNRTGIGEYRTAKYDMGIRNKVRVKSLLYTVVGIILAVNLIDRQTNILRLEEYAAVEADQTISLAGAQLVLEQLVPEGRFTIDRINRDTGEYEEVTFEPTFGMDETLLVFTGTVTNISSEELTVSHSVLKLIGVPQDVGQGNQLTGSWLADGNNDERGDMHLAPGEEANVYFWVTFSKEQLQLPYTMVLHDGENYYKVDLNSF